MGRSAVSKVMWVGRATVFLVGLAVIVGVVFGLASTAFASNGDPLRLGQGNVATKLTSLGGKLGVNGAMLKLVNKNAGADDTALRLEVDPTEPPMSINSTTKVTGFNADQLDGKDASQFVANSTYMAEYNPNGTFPNQGGPGTILGDGTSVISKSCDSGDRLLSGGPASVNANSVVLDSYPSDPVTWTARIKPSAGGDNWTVVVLCADQ
jgi:hypothetical protein